jgi:hypothetical protein
MAHNSEDHAPGAWQRWSCATAAVCVCVCVCVCLFVCLFVFWFVGLLHGVHSSHRPTPDRETHQNRSTSKETQATVRVRGRQIRAGECRPGYEKQAGKSGNGPAARKKASVRSRRAHVCWLMGVRHEHVASARVHPP